MNLTIETYLVIALLILYADIIIVLKVVLNRLKATGRKERTLKDEEDFINGFSQKYPLGQIEQFSESYKQLKASMLLDYTVNEGGKASTDTMEAQRQGIKKLNSIFKLRRMEGAVELGYLGSDRARTNLETAIIKEKDTPVKLYIANALSDIGNRDSIPVLVSTLINSHRWYRKRVNMLLISFGEKFNNYLPEIKDRKEAEIKELIVDFARTHFSSQLKDYLIKILEQEGINYSKSKYERMDKINRCCGNCIYGRDVDNEDSRLCKYKGLVSPYDICWRFKRLPVSIDGGLGRQQLAYAAAEVLASYYPKVMYDERYINNEDVRIKNIAIKALSKGDPFTSVEILITLLNDDEVANTAVKCISEIIDRNPEFIQKIIKGFRNEKDDKVKSYLGEILSNKIEYFIMRLVSQEKESAREIIEQVLTLGKTSETIDFMNKNRDIDIENELVVIIKKIVSSKTPALKKEFEEYLNQRILIKCGLTPWIEPPVEKTQSKDKSVARFVYAVILFIFLLFPIIFIVRYSANILSLPYLRQVGIYVVDFNYYIAFYAIAINVIYLMLIMLSVINVRRQSRQWKLKSSSLLFKDEMLPGISVIAPAFNEEKSIIESANSLLNLVYPDYELIIVNDGSTDKTMDVLIKTFDLKRVDFKDESNLNTKHIRGVYINKSIPKLVVVDKLNGGKADSLNAGINKSRKEYFCGIDADSVLEPNALLKLASKELDAGMETPALGGNIFPANGCTIEQGSIINKHLPKNSLARFQTIEYLRAFMAGRLGWAFSNCLLIISGAFGLFRKERVVDVGGYLTISGEYEKHTVGEDMELVVRIRRMMREKGLKFKIDYVYNANCWTEVPEDFNSLRTQRYRWHKGLIEILTFHKKMMLNPSYGRDGLVAMPYFFLFEFIGPFIEIQGYLMVLLAMILGLMNIQIALLLFIAIILMGTLVSLVSLLIAQDELENFSGKDISVLIAYAILENFGVRQMISIWRFLATVRLLWRQDGWGKAERKGFGRADARPKE